MRKTVGSLQTGATKLYFFLLFNVPHAFSVERLVQVTTECVELRAKIESVGSEE
jgi:hypothetical protein